MVSEFVSLFVGLLVSHIYHRNDRKRASKNEVFRDLDFALECAQAYWLDPCGGSSDQNALLVQTKLSEAMRRLDKLDRKDVCRDELKNFRQALTGENFQSKAAVPLKSSSPKFRMMNDSMASLKIKIDRI